MTADLRTDEANVRATCNGFRLDGQLMEIESFERGHIHDTFVSTWLVGGCARRYLHQRINHLVFQDVAGLMHNIELVTEHLRRKLDSGTIFRTLRVVPTVTGATYLETGGAYWRTYEFVENTRSFDQCAGPAQAFEVARVFARFQNLLSDIDVAALRETIPDFFSSPRRLAQLESAASADAVGRRAAAADELAFVDERRDLVEVIENGMRDGDIPRRIVHGDTKLNNVLFSTINARAVCVVDLDTCMPAYSLYDFGDLVRFTAARHAEDETDLGLVGIDLELYDALVAGYRDQASSFLTKREVELMPVSARLVTMTIGMRFLTDYLAGDVYFKTAREHHNLERCRTQFEMVRDMERNAAAMATS